MSTFIDDDSREILRLATPICAGIASFVLIHLVDLFWVGYLGKAALAAISVAGGFLFFIFTLTGIARGGATTLVSQALGRGDEVGMRQATADALSLGALFGLLVFAIAYPNIEGLIACFGLDHESAHLAIQYCQVIFLGIPLWFVGEAAVGHYFGAGRVKALVGVIIGSNCLNAVLDPLFIFGWGPVPAMGITGAAAASLAAVSVGCLCYVAMLAFTGRVGLGDFGWRPARLKVLISIGGPAAGREVSRPLANLVLFRIIATFGAAAVAAFGIALRYVGVMGTYIGATGIACSTLVGRRVGAGRQDEIHGLLSRGLQLGLTVHLLQAALMTLAAPHFLALFDSGGEVVASGTLLIRLLAWSSTFVLCTHVMNAAFKGVGTTWPLFVCAIVTNWVVQVPLAGVAGWIALSLPALWGVIALGHACETALIGSFFRRVDWSAAEDM